MDFEQLVARAHKRRQEFGLRLIHIANLKTSHCSSFTMRYGLVTCSLRNIGKSLKRESRTLMGYFLKNFPVAIAFLIKEGQLG